MTRLTRSPGQILPGFLAVQHLLNLNAGDELNTSRILSEPAMPHFAGQTAVLKLNLHAGSGRQVVRAYEAQTAFGDIHYAARFPIHACSPHRADFDGEVGGVAQVAALLHIHKVITRLTIGRSRSELYTT